MPIPDCSTLSRRAAGLDVALSRAASRDDGDEPRHIVIDSAGRTDDRPSKVYGEGEWRRQAHGASKRCTWRKRHLAVDPDTGEITATELTDNATDDASQVEPLPDDPDGPVQTVGGDGAYDRWKAYRAIAAVEAEPVVPPQRNADVPSAMSHPRSSATATRPGHRCLVTRRPVTSAVTGGRHGNVRVGTTVGA